MAKRTSNKGSFTKGKSGNPTGRPKLPKEVKEAFAYLLPDAIQLVQTFLFDKTIQPAIRLKAAEIVLERNLGKASQIVEGGDKPITIQVVYEK